MRRPDMTTSGRGRWWRREASLEESRLGAHCGVKTRHASPIKRASSRPCAREHAPLFKVLRTARVDRAHQLPTPTMATLLPPPKRQKLYHGVPEPEPEPVRPSPNVVVQFVSEDDGAQLAPAVSLPANVSRDDLQSLVNSLTKNVCLHSMHAWIK